MITIAAYFMGRDLTHADELTDDIWANGLETVRRTNLLRTKFHNDGGTAPGVRSGWRPAEINAKVGGSRGSHHMSGRAVDIEDDDRTLARWCAAHTADLEAAGIWMERPEATESWVHWQTVPPGSGARYYWPSVAAYRSWVAKGQEPIII